MSVDWLEKNPWAKHAFGGLHAAGAIVLPAFGAGAAVQPLTALETKEGVLPDWARGFGASDDSKSAVVVDRPDFVVVVRGDKADVVAAPVQVGVVGGKRFDGNGYKSGDGLAAKKISFGYAKPDRVVFASAQGDKFAVEKLDKVLFLGGTEATTTIKGSTMSDVLGAISTRLRRVFTAKSKKKSLAAAVASANAAAKRADSAGKAALVQSKRTPKTPSLKDRATKITGPLKLSIEHVGLDGLDGIFLPAPPIDMLGDDQFFRMVYPAINADREYGTIDLLGVASHLEICGDVGSHLEILGASPELRALAAKAAASSAKLAEAKRRAAQAPALAAKAARSVDNHEGKLMAHTQRAEKAKAQGQAAVDRGRAASQAIADQVVRLKKLGVKVAGDAADMKQVYDRMPGDAVAFPTSKAIDANGIGSWSLYYLSQAEPVGYFWDGEKWAMRMGNVSYQELQGVSTQQVAVASGQGLAIINGQQKQIGATMGPIVGNPSLPDYANLRYSVGDNKLWWLADEAPAYATRERDEALALLQKQEEEANAAADAAAQAAADQAQAAQDAETAAMNAKYDLQQAELARQAELQAQQLEMEDQKLQAELEAQQAREDAQIRQATLDYTTSHLEEGMAKEAADGGGVNEGEVPPSDEPSSRDDMDELDREFNRQ